MTLRRNIIHIPLEGGSGIYPSGSLEFDQDWPGLRIRGDDCLYLRIELQSLKEKCKKRAGGEVNSPICGFVRHIDNPLLPLLERRVHRPRPAHRTLISNFKVPIKTAVEVRDFRAYNMHCGGAPLNRGRLNSPQNFKEFLLSFCVFPCDSVAEKALHD